MLEMEVPEKMGGAPSNSRSHDTKRFRLRAVSHEGEIYQRYFNSALARKLSWLQLILGVIITLIQVTMTTTLQMEQNITYPLEIVSWAAWGSFLLLSSAALLSMWASIKPSYAKLHFAMGLNIAGVCALTGFIYALKNIQIPTLVEELRVLREENCTPSPFPNYDDGARAEYRHGLEKLIAASIIGSTLLGSIVLGQALVSLFMAFQTGRAICCGRTHLEGRFLEMEAVTKDKENADAIVNFRLGRRESGMSSVSPPSPTFSLNNSQTGSPPPPPYTSAPPTLNPSQSQQIKLTELREEIIIKDN